MLNKLENKLGNTENNSYEEKSNGSNSEESNDYDTDDTDDGEEKKCKKCNHTFVTYSGKDCCPDCR